MAKEEFRIKQYTRAAAIKISALKDLSKMIFTESETISQVEFNLCYRFLNLLHEKDVMPIQAAAAGAGLDLILPGWRSHFPNRIIGKVVDRNDPEVISWRSKCLERDGNKCVECGSTESLSVHHILHWSEFPETRIDEENGVTLCGECHHSKHPELAEKLFKK